MAPSVTVSAVGEITLDRYLPEGDEWLGGISMNFARSARAAGAVATVFAPVGDDERGRRVVDAMERHGLSRAGVRRVAGATARQDVRIGDGGERIFCGFEAGVLVDYAPDEAELERIDASSVVALCWSPESRAACEACLARPARTGRLTVVDVSIDSPVGDAGRPDSWVGAVVDRADVVFVGGRRDFVEPLAAVARTSRARIVLTAGADGAYALGADGVIHQPSTASRIVDTTGCGDAFQGAFAVALARGAEVAACLRAGADAAAEAAGRRGSGVRLA